MEIDILVAQCLEGERSAQRAIYNKLAGRVMAVCKRYLKKESEAEDLFQDSLIQVFNKLSLYNSSKGNIESWACKIAVNKCLMHLRKRKNVFEEDIEEYSDIESSSENLYDKLSHQELIESIRLLPDKQRLVFNLYAIEGYSHKEIGEMLNINEGTSKSQVFKARVALIKLLEKTKVN